MEKTASSKKLGNMPIPKLLFIMSAPAILSMLVQALYNIVDSIFVAKISENALTALAIAFPMQMLVLAFSVGLGIGTGSIVSRRLGESDRDEAVKLAQNGLFLAVCLSVIWLAFGYLISKGFAALFSKPGTEIFEYTRSYLFICVTFSFGSVFELYINKLMQAIGNMIVPMLTQLIGAVINIALDPLFIFGAGNMRGLGVKGAAIATVIGQCAAMVFAVTMFIVKKHELKFSLRGFRPNKKNIGEIIKLGLPITVLNSISSIATTVMNSILIVLSTTAVAVQGVYFKLQSFIFMPIFGVNQGSLPIEAYNYGARNKKRFMHTYELCIAIALVYMFIGTTLFHTIPDKMLSLFEASDEMQSIGVHALRIISISFIPAAFSVTTINMFQALGHGWKSMLMSILRQFGLLIPLAVIIAKYSGLDNVWISYPVAEIATMLIFVPIAAASIKKAFNFNSPLEDFAPPVTYVNK